MNELRTEILKIIAQTTPTNLPTSGVAQTTPVSGDPRPFVPTQWYPTLAIGFGTRNANIINGFAKLLNVSLYYASSGQVQMDWMRTVNFNFGIDQSPSLELKYLMGFAKEIFKQLYNSGLKFTKALTPQEISERVNMLRQSQYVSNLPQTNPSGPLGIKIQGNLKTLILDYLNYIK